MLPHCGLCMFAAIVAYMAVKTLQLSRENFPNAGTVYSCHKWPHAATTSSSNSVGVLGVQRHIREVLCAADLP